MGKFGDRDRFDLNLAGRLESRAHLLVGGLGNQEGGRTRHHLLRGRPCIGQTSRFRSFILIDGKMARQPR